MFGSKCYGDRVRCGEMRKNLREQKVGIKLLRSEGGDEGIG